MRTESCSRRLGIKRLKSARLELATCGLAAPADRNPQAHLPLAQLNGVAELTGRSRADQLTIGGHAVVCHPVTVAGVNSGAALTTTCIGRLSIYRLCSVHSSYTASYVFR